MRPAPFCALAAAAFLSACTQSLDAIDEVRTSALSQTSTAKRTHAYPASGNERECLARAMFFESVRSSREGLVAVGTVVMNRVASDQYPDTICAVVGQHKQFAPGVLTRPMESGALPDVMAAADAVLAGERHPSVHGNVKFFHQAGLTFPYNNMHYVLEAGGNAFYEKRSRRVARQIASTQESAAEAAAPLAYDIAPRDADAIGALLAGNERFLSPD